MTLVPDASPAPFAGVPDAAAPDAAVPDAATGPFAAVPAVLRSALEQRGFDSLTPVQQAVLADEQVGRDLQISSQTGSGKTVALGFVLARELTGMPADHGPEVLIIVPTRELAAQVCKELRWLLADLGVRLGVVTGGTPIFRDKKMLAGDPRVLVGTPGRLLDHLRGGALNLSNVGQLVLDEADQMLDMGFREELEGILDATPPTRRTHLVSATFPEGIRQLAKRYQQDPAAIEGTPLGDVNADIAHEGYLVHQRDRYTLLVNLLLLRREERTLVFVERRADALEVAERLEADGFAALPLSGELAQSQRDRTLTSFRDGRVTVLVATDVAARGIDVPDVGMVIQTAPPIDGQVYVHRSGRTGRAGKAGRSVLFAPANRRRRVERLVADAGVDLTWSRPPAAASVEEELAHRAREVRRAGLAQVLERGVSDAWRQEAEALLDGRDACDVVAALLARAEPERKVRARDVVPQRDTPRESYDRGRPSYGQQRSDRFQRGERGARPDRPDRFDRPDRPDRPRRDGGPRPQRRGPEGDSVRFFINWGKNQGATPGRLLAAICRRGEVTGGEVGSIAVHPNASTFDVSGKVAEKFERLAGRRDARDPHTRIRRDRGPRSPRS